MVLCSTLCCWFCVVVRFLFSGENVERKQVRNAAGVFSSLPAADAEMSVKLETMWFWLNSKRPHPPSLTLKCELARLCVCKLADDITWRLQEPP